MQAKMTLESAIISANLRSVPRSNVEAFVYENTGKISGLTEIDAVRKACGRPLYRYSQAER